MTDQTTRETTTTAMPTAVSCNIAGCAGNCGICQPTPTGEGSGKYRKKSVVIEAIQYGPATCEALCAWMGIPHRAYEGEPCGVGEFMIETLEGPMRASPGDWIIRGVKGEFYPCKPDIFAATYEPAEVPTPLASRGTGVPSEKARALVANHEKVAMAAAHLGATELGDAESAVLAHIAELEEQVRTLSAAAEQEAWRCFHCEEVFTDRAAAREHFGATQISAPACQIDAAHLRELEAELAGYRDEDTQLHREVAKLHADHAAALQREEEKGYARGLADAAEQGERDRELIERMRLHVAAIETRNGDGYEERFERDEDPDAVFGDWLAFVLDTAEANERERAAARPPHQGRG